MYITFKFLIRCNARKVFDELLSYVIRLVPGVSFSLDVCTRVICVIRLVCEKLRRNLVVMCS